MRTVGTLLFPEFELLDVFGPLEMFGMLADDYRLRLVAERAGPVASRQGPQAIADTALEDAPALDILLIPGGRGTRREVDNAPLIDWLSAKAEATPIVATVCTGAALLARTGLLDERAATSNKAAFGWVMEQGPRVRWRAHARWVVDGKYYTSSGAAADRAEYRWNSNPDDDPFADLYDLSRV